jgi:ArsR family transcriptional regulator, arsenate/arsenite/antimonite-responsive transcriptional repressor
MGRGVSELAGQKRILWSENYQYFQAIGAGILLTNYIYGEVTCLALLALAWATPRPRKLPRRSWPKLLRCDAAAAAKCVLVQRHWHQKQAKAFLDRQGSVPYNSTQVELMIQGVPMSNAVLPPTDLPSLAERLKILAEPNRLLIINLLMEGVQCNCELGDHLQIAPNLISHHLSVLRQAGLVDAEHDALDARWIYYSVNRAALDELNAAFGAFFDPARIKPRRRSCGPHTPMSTPEAAISRK